MDDESRPNIFRQEVTLADGFVKTVVAGSEEELAEGVAAVQNDSYPVSPDLHNPQEANQIVSPDNKAVEDAPVFIDNDVHEAPVEEAEETPAKGLANKTRAELDELAAAQNLDTTDKDAFPNKQSVIDAL